VAECYWICVCVLVSTRDPNAVGECRGCLVLILYLGNVINNNGHSIFLPSRPLPTPPMVRSVDNAAVFTPTVIYDGQIMANGHGTTIGGRECGSSPVGG
jgi:hypothetical protein